MCEILWTVLLLKGSEEQENRGRALQSGIIGILATRECAKEAANPITPIETWSGTFHVEI